MSSGGLFSVTVGAAVKVDAEEVLQLLVELGSAILVGSAGRHIGISGVRNQATDAMADGTVTGEKRGGPTMFGSAERRWSGRRAATVVCR